MATGLARRFDAPRQPRVVKAQTAVEPLQGGEVRRHAERADRVPDADIAQTQRMPGRETSRGAPASVGLADADVRRDARAEGAGGVGVRMRSGGAAAVEIERRVDLAGVTRLRNGAVPDQAGQRARGEGAAREAEEVDLVAGRVVEDQEPVRVGQRRHQTAPEKAAERAVRGLRDRTDAASGSDAVDVADDLNDPVRRAGKDRLGDPRHVGRTVGVQSVPCSVAADDDAFHAGPSRRTRAGAALMARLVLWMGDAAPRGRAGGP